MVSVCADRGRMPAFAKASADRPRLHRSDGCPPSCPSKAWRRRKRGEVLEGCALRSLGEGGRFWVRPPRVPRLPSAHPDAPSAPPAPRARLRRPVCPCRRGVDLPAVRGRAGREVLRDALRAAEPQLDPARGTHWRRRRAGLGALTRRLPRGDRGPAVAGSPKVGAAHESPAGNVAPCVRPGGDDCLKNPRGKRPSGAAAAPPEFPTQPADVRHPVVSSSSLDASFPDA